MSILDLSIEHWASVMKEESSRTWIKRLMNLDLELCHYKGFLLETYHNTKINPQLQGFSTLFFKDIDHKTAKKFFLHASSEVSHEALAFDDLVNLGVTSEFILKSTPLPTTICFNATAIFHLLLNNPVHYLGYLFHLEYTPIVNGDKFITMIEKMGVKKESLSFLDEHISVDPVHVKMLGDYMESLVKTEDDKKALLNGITNFVVLHNRLLEGAFENGSRIFK